MKSHGRSLVLLMGLLGMAVSARGATVVVGMTNTTFTPVSVSLAVGDTVRWTNTDSIIHTTTSGTTGTPDYVWDSGVLAARGSYEFTFNAPGRFAYVCTIHAGQTGMVEVATNAIAVAASLAASQTTVSTGQQATVGVTVTCQSGTYDVYLVAETPWGQWYSLNGNLQFVGPNVFTPLATGWNGTNVPLTPLFTLSRNGLPTGAYVFHFIFVNANAALSDTSRWQAQSTLKVTLR